MAIAGPWAIAVYGEDIDWGVVPVPTAEATPAEEIQTFSDEKSIGMFTACENQATAWDVLKFATSEEQDGALLEISGQMPMRTDLLGTFPEYFEANPDYAAFAEQADRTIEVPNVANSIEVWQTFRDAWSESVIFGDSDPQEALTAAAEDDQRTRRRVGDDDTMAATASPSVAGAGSFDPAPARRRERIPLRQQLAGYLFVSPWVVFFVGIFAYPLGFAIWMSFYDYFFAAPGATVERPFVGFDNYWDALTDEDVRQSFRNIVVFLVINVPLTVILAIALAMALNAVIPFRAFFRTAFFLPYVTASVALIGVWLWLFRTDGLVNTMLGPLAPDPSWLDQRTARHADDRHLRHVEGARLLHPAVPRRACRTCRRSCTRRRRSTEPDAGGRSAASRGRASGRPRRWSSCWRSSPAPTCSPSRTC